jgi:hypothetical protein
MVDVVAETRAQRPKGAEGTAPVGSQIRFATQVLKGTKPRASRRPYGNQIRFAVRTVKKAIARRRGDPRRNGR